jgi:hypothetical protein
MVTSWWSSGLRLPAVAGSHWWVSVWAWSWARSRRAWRAAAHPLLGSLGAAGGPRQRERSLGGALLFGGREPLAVPVGGELGELVHGGHLLSRR